MIEKTSSVDARQKEMESISSPPSFVGKLHVSSTISNSPRFYIPSTEVIEPQAESRHATGINKDISLFLQTVITFIPKKSDGCSYLKDIYIAILFTDTVYLISILILLVT